jgi:hypothetical protein
MRAEEWRDVVGYEKHYKVSNLGKVKSLNYNGTNKEGILKGSKCGAGYLKVLLCKGGLKKNKRIHQLVAESFLGHKPEKGVYVVDHIDEDRLNNKLENLQIISHRANISKSKKLNSDKSSKYTGVIFIKSKNTFRADAKLNGKSKFLGHFKSELEAKDAYINFLKTL